ncbi:MAG: response regulator transcription factor [Alphaproteobacteria bacterium]|nr:response regulator transcription factor [Alphaproteobacteria bacterium]
MIRVFLADDHAIVRLGLRHALTELGGFEVVGEADNGRQVLNAPELARCDVLVLDLSLPVVSGIEVLRRVRERHPGLAIVVHSMYPEGQFRRRVVEAGACAYVPKDAHPSELLRAITAAAGVGAPPHEPAPVAEPDLPHTTLTARELEVFLLVLDGRQVTDIAAELDVHASTVSNHLAKVRQKLDVRTTAEMVRYAYAAGILAPPPTDDGP